ncbi:hypothetical protein ASG43_07910 [Aureimonas sp. Leaf454]|uniref:hypothetical protein n=1 Tax=Aureimonas sp. Leaf454 TaxID=1736381 RepID=UPI0006F9B442|nr:hypothetical protein [Aureimonas sp. Leaf454]KQT48771.1 hypothetical protein ASG43_07910 [Aureimonas sp. Leaf454]
MTKSHVATQLSRQAVRAINEWRAADAANMPTAEHHDRIAALGAEASFHPAGSPEAALFMLGVLNGLAEHLDDVQGRTASRLIEHVAAFLEATTGADRGALAGWSLEARTADVARAA